MVRLTYARVERLPSREVIGRTRVAIEHALIHARPSLWGDDNQWPESAILIRGRGKQREAYGIGSVQPAITWLAEKSRGGPVSLIAPGSWGETVTEVFGPIERSTVETWCSDARVEVRPAPPVTVRRLTVPDAFHLDLGGGVPGWIWQSWGSFLDLVLLGAVFAVPHENSFAAIAWTYERGFAQDAIGVWTEPRFRRLGLGRAVALALIDHIRASCKHPIWVTTPDNEASRAMARSVGFSCQANETMLRWPARQPKVLGRPR